MNEKARPTARMILDGVIRAMHMGQEPLDEGLVLVPPSYDVSLHPEAYQALATLVPRIKLQARKRLDAELAALNAKRTAGAPGWRARLRALIQRLFFADRFRSDTHTAANAGATYERAGEAWLIDISATPEPDADTHYLAVETSFDTGIQTRFKGRPTISIRRRTVVLPDGRFETVVSAERTPAAPHPAGATPAQAPAAETPAAAPAIEPPAPRPVTPATIRTPPVGRTANPEGAIARLRYEDNTGPHVFYMNRPVVRLGRHADDEEALDLAFHTLPDVSRVHTLVRHNPDQGTFSIKDVSRFGVTVNGVRIHTARAAADDAETGWHPLPRHARIVLADAIFITFDAL